MRPDGEPAASDAPKRVAIVLTAAASDAHAERSFTAACDLASAIDATLIVAPYGQADRAIVALWCRERNVMLAPAAADASFGAAANAGVAAGNGSDAFAIVNGAELRGAPTLAPLLAALAVPGGGIAGPMIVRADGGDECGIIATTAPFTFRGFAFQSVSRANTRMEFDAVPSDCIITSREAFAACGGFDPAFDAELASIDYCLRCGELGYRTFIEPSVTFVRGPQPPDPTRERQHSQSDRAFALRWRGRIETRENFWPEVIGTIGRPDFYNRMVVLERWPPPAVHVLVHGDGAPAPQFMERLAASRMQPVEVLWAAAAPAPPGTRAVGDAIAAARALTEVRGMACIAFVRCDTVLGDDWLNDLINALFRLPDTVAATVCDGPLPAAAPATADARCTLVAPRVVPQHLRIAAAASLDAALGAWLASAVACGRMIAPVTRTATHLGAPASAIAAARPLATARPLVAAPPSDVFVSIVMLSWNAPQFTELAVTSIREQTPLPHEIIVIDNGSGPETLASLARIGGIRVIENAVNTGFAFGCNQGLAAARGTHIVLLNNDVIVTAGWLEALLDVQRKNPAVGCSAPRSNKISGAQQVDDVPYRSLATLPGYGIARELAERGGWTRHSRAVGFCLCLPRYVVDEIGGLDPRYGSGNFEDDDYCLRIEAAGYDIAHCDAAFIHHFGSVSFQVNRIDYNATLRHNRSLFAERWGVTIENNIYDGRLAFRRGFVRARDYIPLPAPVGVDATWISPA